MLLSSLGLLAIRFVCFFCMKAGIQILACFARSTSDGIRVILAVTYVDDVTFVVSDDADQAYFISMLRSRFEIEDGEGKPIQFLLGMAIEQNLGAGTIIRIYGGSDSQACSWNTDA